MRTAGSNLFIVCYFLVAIALVVDQKLPSGFRVCKTSEPDPDGCFKSAIQDALPRLKNAMLYLISRWNLTKTNFTATIFFVMPETRMEADYELNGRILLLPILGKGKCKIVLKNVKGKVDFRAAIYEKKGKRYFKVEDFKIELDPGKLTYEFENLFNGDKRLGKEMNNVLNENWKEVFYDVKSGYEELFGVVCKDYSNKIFNKVPYDELRPE